MKPAKKKNTPASQTKSPGRTAPGAKATFNPGQFLPLMLLAGSVLLVIMCRLRLLGVPLERDEGEYAYVAQQMLHGIPPFVSIYHVKLPGVYGAYCLIMALFGQNTEGIRLGLLFVNLLTGIPLYLIARRLFGPVTAAYATSVFLLMSISQSLFGFSANSEQFILLFLLSGILLMLIGIDLLKSGKTFKTVLVFFLAGTMMGIAYLMKQNAVFFIAFAGLFFLYKVLTAKPVSWKNLFINGFVFAIGAGLPLALVCMIFFKLGLFDKFWWWTWVYPRIYVTSMPWDYGKLTLQYAITGTGSRVGILYSFWAIIALAVWGIISILFQRSMDRKVFTIGLLLVSAIAITVGLNFFAHYFQLAVPVVAILVAAGCESLLFFWKGKQKIADAVFPGFLVLLLALIIFINKEKDYLFEMDGTAVSHVSYGANPFPEAIEIGKYIAQNSSPDDKIVVLGSEPEIYFYANRRAVTGFIYTYEIYKHHPYAHPFQQQMADEIDTAKPKFIVMMNIDASWFSGYTDRSDTFLFNWSARYINSHYTEVGLIDLMYPQPDRYCWDSPEAPCIPQTQDHNIQIFVRKKE
jgi:4-amino-4-deoxy-L-arabinose transferase-like glycosyltransferase